MDNLDRKVVDGFGEEWERFDQSPLADSELRVIFDAYFSIFPWEELPSGAVGMDVGCGSGRWARFVAPRVGRLLCFDASAAALAVAERNLAPLPNCEIAQASVDSLPVEDGTMDFGYSLGVLHHVPDTAEGIRACAAKLRKGAPFLLYLYYAFDQRPLWFRMLWRTSEMLRLALSRAPGPIRRGGADVIAAIVYWPLARTARLLESLGAGVDAFPLSYYRRRSFYVMRNDSLDRFGTRLEQRFTRTEIEAMMLEAGLGEIRFSDDPPYWCAVGRKL
jgi:SAM-dependent methyltransferase